MRALRIAVRLVIDLYDSLASKVDLRPGWRKELDREFQQRIAQAWVEGDAKRAEALAGAKRQTRVEALEQMALEIKHEWPGGYGNETEARRTIRHCVALGRAVAEVMDEDAFQHDRELLQRLTKVQDACARWELEAWNVVSSPN